jgi:hypothetical protein
MWSDLFTDTLGSGAPLVWVVRTVRFFQEATWNTEYLMSTHPTYGDGILTGPPTTQGSRVSLSSWQATIGGFTFTAAPTDLTNLRNHVVRGTHVEVLTGAYGQSIEEFGRVGIGRVQNIRWNGRIISIEITDALALLDGRPEHTGTQIDLFNGLDDDSLDTSALTADYTAGDATITVGDTSAFAWDAISYGAIVLGGFVLTYTGKTATTFTGVSSTGKFGTATADVASGEDVTEAALIYGHPIHTANRLLASTGAGTNGAYDDYPEDWGFAIPSDYLDTHDSGLFEALVMTVSTGSYDVGVLVQEPQPQPRSWFTEWLSRFGCFPVMHQGKLSIRAGSFDNRIADAETVTDRDIRPESLQSEWFDSTRPIEYGSAVATTGLTSSTSGADSVYTLPGAQNAYFDLSGLWISNPIPILADVRNRMSGWTEQIGEVLTLHLVGLSWSRLTPGDWLHVKITHSCTRFDYSGGMDCFITQVTPDYVSGVVTVRAVTPVDSRLA